MPPVGIHEIALPGPEGFVAFQRRAAAGMPTDRTGHEPAGHLDQTMHVTGTVVLDGASHQVECVSNRDHPGAPVPR
jgi:hypothetical protein